MTTHNDIFKKLCELAPLELAMEFDNPGFLFGSKKAETTGVMVSLDITPEVIAEADEKGANLIVSHHPIFRKNAQSSLTDETYSGGIALLLGEKKFSAICMHTNLDIADGGVNDTLAKILELQNIQKFLPEIGLGRMGVLNETLTLEDFVGYCKNKLNTQVVKYSKGTKPPKKIAVCGGSGGDLIPLAAKKGCDTLVSADIKHSQFLEAKYYGINLLDCGHFATENVVMPVVEKMLKNAFVETPVFVSGEGEPYLATFLA